MEQGSINQEHESQREQLIEFITRAIRQIDERKLYNIYNFVLHIQ